MEHTLLQGFSSAEMEQVLALGSHVTIPSGAALFRLGESADRLYLVERGRIRLSFPMLLRGHEEDVLFEELTAGQTVGWSAMVPPYRFTLSATAPLETQVIALPRETLCAFFEQSPEIGRKFGFNLLILVGQRLQLVQTMWMREIQRVVELRAAKTIAVQ